MINKTIVLMCVFVFVVGFMYCGEIFAQGPIDNARQFQEKAVNSALRSSRNQNFTAKQEYVEWVDTRVSDKDDNLKKGDSSSLINIGNQTSGNTK